MSPRTKKFQLGSKIFDFAKSFLHSLTKNLIKLCTHGHISVQHIAVQFFVHRLRVGQYGLDTQDRKSGCGE